MLQNFAHGDGIEPAAFTVWRRFQDVLQRQFNWSFDAEDVDRLSRVFDACRTNVPSGNRSGGRAFGSKVKKQAMPRPDFKKILTSLDMKISFAPFNTAGRQRIAQLINKTNQFNLTTRRYTEREVMEMEKDPSVFTLQVRLADKFGDLGMIGIVICREPPGDSSTWEIDTWLMSCRVLGRKVEQAIFAKMAAEAGARGIRRLVGLYLPTAKNGMVAEHYEKLGFRDVSGENGGQTVWKMSLAEYSPPELRCALRISSPGGMTGRASGKLASREWIRARRA
jgi:predicted enzyme involved in methoxymalonyl-ACP biosynthesis